MIALIDNYDSFTFNLYHQLSQFYSDIHVFPCDKVTADELKLKGVKALVFSPGPGDPYQSGNTLSILNEFYKTVPILGICLGMQLIACKFGARYRQMQVPMHGIKSKLSFKQTGLLRGIKEDLIVGRYHSLEIIEDKVLKKNFNINAKDEIGTIMSIEHKIYPIFGFQFHPESILTPLGNKLISLFFEEVI